MTARHPLPDEPVQVVTIAATGGTFTLTYSGQQTGPLGYGAAAADLRHELEALGRIGAGNVAVSGPDGGPFELRFGGELTGRNVAVVEADGEGLDGTVSVTTEVPSPWE
jgi:trimeric autotransporter adhesin